MFNKITYYTNYFIILLLIMLFSLSRALICYENNEEGEVKEVSNNDWNYCMLIPHTTSDLRRGRLSGIGPINDYTKIYDETFSASNSLYTILSMCILERYNFTPLFKQRKLEPEFMFRCVCNYDKCNSEANFQNYLSAIVKDNK